MFSEIRIEGSILYYRFIRQCIMFEWGSKFINGICCTESTFNNSFDFSISNRFKT